MNDAAIHEVRPDIYVYGGEVMGRLVDGRAVFIPLAIPGELVRVRLVEEKRSYVRAELVEVLEASPERIEARCRHFGECGGCHYQHLPYPLQLAAKREILRDQLKRNGKIENPPVAPTVPSTAPFYYRNQIQFHLSQEGWLGFEAARSNRVVPIRECHLPVDSIGTVWPQLQIEPVPGLGRVALRAGADETQLILESSDPQALEFSVEELPISAVHLGPGGCLVLAGSEAVVFEVCERLFQVSAGSFFQVNTSQAEAMVKHLLASLPLTPQSTVLDVYCGVGLFSAFLAQKAGQVIGIEASESACQDFTVNLDEFENVSLYQARAEETLTSLNFNPDVIVVDPPRAGLGRTALDGLLAQRAGLVAYVSCDPSTLARDARRLAEAGYRLVQVTPFDLFPQTYHIESISLWSRE
jgi:23S rRNA (uracil1939-C5)-methyltransferase